jgi:protein-tyrosine phosphatase
VTIDWDGFHNARDLGGLPTREGAMIRPGALIRSAGLFLVTEAGWRAAYGAGIRTIVDLRNDDEIRPGAEPGLTALGGSAVLTGFRPLVDPPSGIERVEVPLDDVEDVEFWRHLNDAGLNGTPLYYEPFLRNKPDRCAAAVIAVARAAPGGVLFHCAGGRDRTGLLALLLLAVLGVDPEVIAADYASSTAPLRTFSEALGREDDGPQIAALMAKHGTTVRDAILDVLDGFDARAYLIAAGVSDVDLAALRERALG